MKKLHNIATIGVLLLLVGRSLGQEEGSGQGSGDTLEAGSGAAEVSEVVEGSGGGPVTVEHSVPYTMSSADGSLTVRLTLEDRSDSESELHLVCDVSATDSSLFSGDSECLPAIYLVSGHQTCSGLPDSISAKKLSDIKKAGTDDALVPATYSELPGKCMLVLRKSSCEGSGGGEAEASGDVVITKKLGEADLDYEEYIRDTEPVLSTRGLTRTYSTISLSGFSLLSSGSTSAFTISVPSVGFTNAVVIPGVVTTNYNKWDTLPYLQLTGWTYNDALNIVGLIGLILLLSQLPRVASLFSLAPTVKRRFFDLLDYAESNEFAARVDALQDGVFDIFDRTKDSIAHPWVGVLKSLGRKYFQNINGYSLDEYVANRKIDNFDYHYDVPAYDDVVSEESQLNSESESQYNFNDIFPEFDKFMSFLK